MSESFELCAHDADIMAENMERIKVKEKATKPAPRRFTITLDERQALDILMVCGSIGGTPGGTVRESTDHLWSALFKVLLPGQGIGDYLEMKRKDPRGVKAPSWEVTQEEATCG